MSRARLRSAAAAAAGARLAYGLLRADPPGGEQRWTRTNHRGEAVTLLEGPAVALGSIAGATLADVSWREQLALVVAGTGAAAFGGYDDLAGDGASRGFRGHIGALRDGKLTTGALKIAGIGATGFAAALVLGQPAGRPRRSAALAVVDVIVDAGLVAGGANLLNLFDLRPGRAIKVAIGTTSLLAVLPGEGTNAAAAPLAAALALLPDDLAERAMLGDAGANALGAMLGVAATRLPRSARITALAGVAGLTAASEVWSFTRVIERTGPLRWLDMLGRRPAGPAAEPSAAAPVSAGQDADSEPPAGASSNGCAAHGTTSSRAPRRAARSR